LPPRTEAQGKCSSRDARPPAQPGRRKPQVRMGLAVGPDPRAWPRLAPARLDGSPAGPGQRSLSQASRRRAGRGFQLGAVGPDEPNAWLAALTAVDPLG